MNLFVIGVGASGGQALGLVDAGIAALGEPDPVRVVGRSRRYQNPAWGGATRAPFVNAAVVVDTTLPASSLLALLFAIEGAQGRVRSARKNQARTLDLDLLWQVAPAGPSSSSSPLLPHPRLLERSFALVPAVEALRSAGLAVPLELAAAARRHALAPLFALPLHAG